MIVKTEIASEILIVFEETDLSFDMGLYESEMQIDIDFREVYEIISSDIVEFHVIEDGKLIIQGAYSMTDLPQGLYLDCTPDVEWESPVQVGNVLYISQVYAATQNGNVLEVT